MSRRQAGSRPGAYASPTRVAFLARYFDRVVPEAASAEGKALWWRRHGPHGRVLLPGRATVLSVDEFSTLEEICERAGVALAEELR